MADNRLRRINGTGITALQKCYELLGQEMDPLYIHDPRLFAANERTDGLVKYEGSAGYWTVEIALSTDQATALMKALVVKVTEA